MWLKLTYVIGFPVSKNKEIHYKPIIMFENEFILIYSNNILKKIVSVGVISGWKKWVIPLGL